MKRSVSQVGTLDGTDMNPSTHHVSSVMSACRVIMSQICFLKKEKNVALLKPYPELKTSSAVQIIKVLVPTRKHNFSFFSYFDSLLFFFFQLPYLLLNSQLHLEVHVSFYMRTDFTLFISSACIDQINVWFGFSWTCFKVFSRQKKQSLSPFPLNPLLIQYLFCLQQTVFPCACSWPQLLP